MGGSMGKLDNFCYATAVIAPLLPMPATVVSWWKKALGQRARRPDATIAALLCNAAWVVYGCTENNKEEALYVNLYGGVVQTVHFVTFLALCSSAERLGALKRVLCAATYLGLTAAVKFMELKEEIHGWLCTLSGSAGVSTPLVVFLLTENKTVEMLPHWTASSFSMVHGAAWLYKGMETTNYYIATQYAVSFSCSAYLLAMVFLLRKAEHQTSPATEDTTKDGDLEESFLHHRDETKKCHLDNYGEGSSSGTSLDAHGKQFASSAIFGFEWMADFNMLAAVSNRSSSETFLAAKSQETAITGDTKSQETAITGDTKIQEPTVTIVTKSKEQAVTDDNKRKESAVSVDATSKEQAFTNDTKHKEPAVTGVTKSQEPAVTGVTKSKEHAVTDDTKRKEPAIAGASVINKSAPSERASSSTETNELSSSADNAVAAMTRKGAGGSNLINRNQETSKSEESQAAPATPKEAVDAQAAPATPKEAVDGTVGGNGGLE